MILTQKSVVKNLKTITEENELITNFIAMKSDIYKRGILSLSSFGKLIVTNAPFLGKFKIIDSFLAKDVEKVDFVSEIKMGGPHVHLLMKINGKNIRFTAFFHPVNNDYNVNEIISSIYAANPFAKPDYLKDIEIVDYLTTKEGTYKLTANEIIVQKFLNNQIEDKERIKVNDITDFDVYPQKMGSKGILYLEVNNKPNIVKFEKTTEENSVGALIAGGTSVMFGLGKLTEMFSKSDIKRKTPSYMSENEIEIITEFATKKALGIDQLGNKIFRLTDENIYYLKKEKSGKLTPLETIPITSIQNYKMISHRTNNQTTYGLSVKTDKNEEFKFWNLELIDWILEEMKSLFNR